MQWRSEHKRISRVSASGKLWLPFSLLQVVVDHLSLSLPSGKVTAICGLSGAGKSTVAALLERFYEPSSGRIYLDHTPLDELDPSWLRDKIIGFINQEPVLFATSIFENIRYGRPTASDQEVMARDSVGNYIACREEILCGVYLCNMYTPNIINGWFRGGGVVSRSIISPSMFCL
jgi:ABC-type branched-subunit amino acid transport system ATPase component